MTEIPINSVIRLAKVDNKGTPLISIIKTSADIKACIPDLERHILINTDPESFKTAGNPKLSKIFVKEKEKSSLSISHVIETLQENDVKPNKNDIQMISRN